MWFKKRAGKEAEPSYDFRDMPFIDLPRVYESYSEEELYVILEALKRLAVASDKYDLDVEPVLFKSDRFDESEIRGNASTLLLGNSLERSRASVQLLAEFVLRAELTGRRGGDLMADFLKDHRDLFKGGFENHSPVTLAGIWQKQMYS